MTKEIEIDIKKYGGCKIAVALSGGRDSIALAYALINSGANFFAVNVEHGIRGEASVADSRFVKDFCDKNNIELLSFSVDSLKFSADSGMTVEQSARALRYDIFDSLLDDCKCDYVALAHHRDDQVETIVMRILRGTGLRGLTAMKEQNGKYIRPLLGYTREDIDDFIKAHNLQYVDDETNGDTAYTRNYLREQLKVIRLRYPSFDEAILRLSRNADEAENFIDKFVGELKLVDGEAFVACADLAEIAVAKRLILKATSSVGVFQDIEERHFPLILGLVTAQNRKRIELPHGLTAQKDGDFIKFFVNANANAKAVEIDCNAEPTNANLNGL
ncbi:MAG: tRNA lysidine(34) synthetase TilS, partial [Clostridia bacterium]